MGLGEVVDNQRGMNKVEKRTAMSLAAIFAMRMIGLFMILPVFSLYAEELSGSTPFLIGLAISAYGLTQAVFQIPFGLMSDRFGRKRMILVGLALFAAGSVVAALSSSIEGVILGRALQGSGAIAAAVMALAADLTREEQRTKVMATIGITIGLSFGVSMILGPVVSQWSGLSGLFWLTMVLALGGMLVVIFWVPTPDRTARHCDAGTIPAQFRSVLANSELLRLDFGIFALHLILTAGFVVLPLALRDGAGLAAADHWLVYLPVMLMAIGLMIPLVILAEKQRKMKQVFLVAIGLVIVAELGFIQFYNDLTGLILFLVIFFTGFNLLEAVLPSMISKIAPPDSKGTAMGVYSSSQFLGAFVGGVSGGYLYGTQGIEMVFLLCVIVLTIWLLIALGMKPTRHLTALLVKTEPLGEVEAKLLEKELLLISGVVEASFQREESVAYLKVDNDRLAREQLFALVKSDRV
jgi:MFS family permease